MYLCFYDSNQRMQSVLLKSPYYCNTSTPTYFAPYLSIIRVHKIVQNSCYSVQLCVPWGPKHTELVGCNIIVILIKLSAFFGSNFSNWIIMDGMENVKYPCVFSKVLKINSDTALFVVNRLPLRVTWPSVSWRQEWIALVLCTGTPCFKLSV